LFREESARRLAGRAVKKGAEGWIVKRTVTDKEFMHDNIRDISESRIARGVIRPFLSGEGAGTGLECRGGR
jgi:hypothetical protein